MDMLMCVDCDEDEITADGKMCMMCATAGHVPNADQNACEPCPRNQIANETLYVYAPLACDVKP